METDTVLEVAMAGMLQFNEGSRDIIPCRLVCGGIFIAPNIGTLLFFCKRVPDDMIGPLPSRGIGTGKGKRSFLVGGEKGDPGALIQTFILMREMEEIEDLLDKTVDESISTERKTLFFTLHTFLLVLEALGGGLSLEMDGG